MVTGLDRFQAHFADHASRYALIGGTASSLAMEELGGSFRATKDLDIVLCVEALDREFVRAFWDFISQGGYENRQKSTGKRLFYRFYGPTQPGFPAMLELFSRLPDALDPKEGATLTPVPVDDEAASLSAILMDDDYYALVMERRTVVRGISLVGAETLIPLKARAYVDLSNRSAAGERVDSRNIAKHKNDIFRLSTVLDRGATVGLAARIQADLREAFARLAGEPADLKAFGISGLQLPELLAELGRIYGLDRDR
mgnify:CR=1 FL=1